MDIVYGGGKYGLKAVEYLIRNNRNFVVIDIDSKCEVMRKLKLPDFKDENEGNSFLKGDVKDLIKLFQKLDPEYVFPTAPIHIAGAFVAEIHGLDVWYDGIDYALSGLPPKIILSAGKGSIVVSYNRDHECLENCSAPDVCPVTKMRKPAPMYDMLKFAVPDGFIIESIYLKPGLGAIKGQDLKNLIEWAEKKDKVIVGTACRCHGVLSSFRRV